MKKWIYILCRNKNTAVASPMETTTYEGEGRIWATNEARIPVGMERRHR